MKFEIKNDGKGKWQSYECTVKDFEFKTYFYGYGADEKESKEECLKMLDKYIEQLIKARKNL